jgi:5'-methylthioadenosine phosphorylase
LIELSPEKIADYKIYAQTRGPRFETRAEVRILQAMGCDVVGMTFGNEADLLLESGVSVTSLCMVDNFAHGIGEEKLTMGGFNVSVGENQAKIDGLLAAFVARFGSNSCFP